MSLDDFASILDRSPDGDVAEAVRSHRVAVEAAAEAAPRVVESLGLSSPDDVDEIRTSVLLGEVAERASNDRARTVLWAAASASDEIEAGSSDLRAEVVSAVEETAAQIDGAEDISQLENLVEEARGRLRQIPELSTGLQIAQAILADGLTTIYDMTSGPLFAAFLQVEPPQPQRSRIRGKILRVAKNDAAGATGGAAGGALAGPHGAAAGAAVGAIGSSVTSVVKGLLDRLFRDS